MALWVSLEMKGRNPVEAAEESIARGLSLAEYAASGRKRTASSTRKWVVAYSLNSLVKALTTALAVACWSSTEAWPGTRTSYGLDRHDSNQMRSSSHEVPVATPSAKQSVTRMPLM